MFEYHNIFFKCQVVYQYLTSGMLSESITFILMSLVLNANLFKQLQQILTVAKPEIV